MNGNSRWTLPPGEVHRRVLRADPTQEYFVYVPHRRAPSTPMLVTVHGLSRNADEHAALFAEYCEALGVVLVAPHFNADTYPDFQRLGRRGGRSDRALNAIVQEASHLTGAAADAVHLVGFSGGAQFAHRYTMAYPRHVQSAVFVAAGWYTFPDVRRRFPYGIRSRADLPGVIFDPEEFLAVPITVIVGENDVEQDGNLRRGERIDEQQGVNRLERAGNWVKAMRETASAYRMKSLVRFEQVPDACHSFSRFMHVGRLGELVVKSLFGVVPLGLPRPDERRELPLREARVP